jgi:AcrR family transcriptional regulator
MNESKKHIIITASKLFLEKSYKEVTMRDIVVQTKLSKGAVYHYFSSKEQLFTEVLRFFFTEVSRDYDKYSKNSFREFYNDYLEDSLCLTKQYLLNFDNKLPENTITLNYFSMMFDALKLFPELKERAIDSFNNEIEEWAKAVGRARVAGEIKSSMTDKEIGEIFMYLSDGVGMHMIMRGADLANMVKPFKHLWDKFYEEIKA